MTDDNVLIEENTIVYLVEEMMTNNNDNDIITSLWKQTVTKDKMKNIIDECINDFYFDIIKDKRYSNFKHWQYFLWRSIEFYLSIAFSPSCISWVGGSVYALLTF